MAVSAVQGNYVYITDPNTGETYQLTQDEAASLFGTENYLGAEDSFATKTVDINMVSVDGKDDGKITFDEKVKSGFKAVADMVLSPITEAAKGNFIPALVAGAGLAIGILTFPVGTIAMGAIGVAGGVATFAKGASDAENATTDAEGRQAYGTMAQGIYTAGMSAGAMAKGIQVQKANPNSNMYGTKGFGETARGYFKDLGQGAADLKGKVFSWKTGTGNTTTTASGGTGTNNNNVPLLEAPKEGAGSAGSTGSTGPTGGGSGPQYYFDGDDVYIVERAYNGAEILTKVDPSTAGFGGSTGGSTGFTGGSTGGGSVVYEQGGTSGQLLLEQQTPTPAQMADMLKTQYQNGAYFESAYKPSGQFLLEQNTQAPLQTAGVPTAEELAIMQYQEHIAGFPIYSQA